MADQQPVPAPARTRRTETAFHVLKLEPVQPLPEAGGPESVTEALIAGNPERYEIVATDILAGTYKQAVAKHCEANKDATDLDGSYIAVRVEDWRPIPVSAKRETVLTIGGGS